MFFLTPPVQIHGAPMDSPTKDLPFAWPMHDGSNGSLVELPLVLVWLLIFNSWWYIHPMPYAEIGKIRVVQHKFQLWLFFLRDIYHVSPRFTTGSQRTTCLPSLGLEAPPASAAFGTLCSAAANGHSWCPADNGTRCGFGSWEIGQIPDSKAKKDMAWVDGHKSLGFTAV